MEVVEEEREVKERESYRQDAGIPFNSYNLRNREITEKSWKIPGIPTDRHKISFHSLSYSFILLPPFTSLLKTSTKDISYFLS